MALGDSRLEELKEERGINGSSTTRGSWNCLVHFFCYFIRVCRELKPAPSPSLTNCNEFILTFNNSFAFFQSDLLGLEPYMWHLAKCDYKRNKKEVKDKMIYLYSGYNHCPKPFPWNFA